MTFGELLSIVKADVRRYPDTPIRVALLHPEFRHTVALRVHVFLDAHRGILGRIARVPLLLYRFRAKTLGFDVSALAEIGPGLYFAPHPGGVVVHGLARIGKNCNLHQGVTIGRKHRGPQAGAPRVGDDVWIGPGAKLVGAITVGDGAVIGPNCVVSEDVPPGGVVAVSRAVLLSTNGSEGYIGLRV